MKYSEWIESIVDQPLPVRPASNNDIVGAIEDDSEFFFFKRTFEERIRRLWTRFPAQQRKLLEKLANIATANWSGPFAELVAADFFAAIVNNIELELKPDSAVLGERFGKGRSELDGKISAGFPLYYEVKALTDVSSKVLEGIRKEIESEFPLTTIRFSYAHDLGERIFADARGNLVEQIIAAIQAGGSYVDTESPPVHVSIRSRPVTLTTTEHSYDPYQQAKNRSLQVLFKWHQLLEEGPNLRVFVVHPWFNSVNSSDFGGTQDIFFRAFARRVFCDLYRNDNPLSDIVPDAPLQLRVSDIARRLGGILFIVDRSVECPEGVEGNTPQTLMRGFLYENPNVLKKSTIELQLDGLKANNIRMFEVVDDFRHDNY